MDPPASAVIKRRSAPGKRSRPVWCHQRGWIQGERGRFGRSPTLAHPSSLAKVVDAIGDGLGVLTQIVSAKSCTVTVRARFRAPTRPSVGVVADQLFLLVSTENDRLAVVDKGLGRVVEVVELGVPVWAPAAFGYLGVGLE